MGGGSHRVNLSTVKGAARLVNQLEAGADTPVHTILFPLISASRLCRIRKPGPANNACRKYTSGYFQFLLAVYWWRNGCDEPLPSRLHFIPQCVFSCSPLPVSHCKMLPLSLCFHFSKFEVHYLGIWLQRIIKALPFSPWQLPFPLPFPNPTHPSF